MNSIIISGPTFTSQEDEELFFLCLNQIPGCSDVKGQGIKLVLAFEGSPTDMAMEYIAVICNRWKTKVEKKYE